MVSIAWMVNPGVFRSIRKRLIPLCLGASGSVRAAAQYQSEKWADVVKRFCPFNRQPSPSRTARSWREARSEPASGSV